MNKAQAHIKYAAAMKIRQGDDLHTTEQAMLAIFPDWKSLTQFAQDVGQHCYHGTYGTSPYDRAFSIAHHALGGCVSNPFVIDSDDYFIAMQYRKRAGLSISRDARGNIVEFIAA